MNYLNHPPRHTHTPLPMSTIIPMFQMSLANLLPSSKPVILIPVWLNPRNLLSTPSLPLNDPPTQASGHRAHQVCQKPQVMGPRLRDRIGLVVLCPLQDGHKSLPGALSLCERFILWVHVLCHLFNIQSTGGRTKLITKFLPWEVFQRAPSIIVLDEQPALVY